MQNTLNFRESLTRSDSLIHFSYLTFRILLNETFVGGSSNLIKLLWQLSQFLEQSIPTLYLHHKVELGRCGSNPRRQYTQTSSFIAISQ